MSKGQRFFRVLAAGAAAIVVGVCLLASSQLAPQRLLLEQDGMAIGSGGMPLSMSGGDDTAASAPASNPFLDAMDAQGLRATGGNALASNPFLDAMESSVVAARSLRQQMGGPSMRESVGRAQLHQLPAKQRAVEAAAAAATLKAYERQEAALRAQASQQLAATPEVSHYAASGERIASSLKSHATTMLKRRSYGDPGGPPRYAKPTRADKQANKQGLPHARMHPVSSSCTPSSRFLSHVYRSRR